MIIYSIINMLQLRGAHRLDSEFFEPQYLIAEKEVLDTKSYQPWDDIEGKFITGPFGSEFNVENYVGNGKYRYIRGKDVKEFFLEGDDNVYIPEKDFQRLKKYSLQDGDILISVVGSPGFATIIDASIPPAIFSCKSTAFRSNAINPYYFVAYLSSSFGQSLLQRSVRGAIQTGLNIDDLKKLPIFIPSTSGQSAVADLVKEAKRTTDESERLCFHAEELLLEELGLKDVKFGEDLAYMAKLSDIKVANRIDADYFQPKYEKLMEQIATHDSRSLDDLVSVKKGIEPGAEAYQDEGKLFIRVSNISRQGTTDKDQKYLSEELYKKLEDDYQPKIGEILLTKDATPGVAYVLKEPIDCIVSGGILRLKTKEDIDPEYISLCINSLVGQMQVERDAGGSVIAHWKPEQVKALQIPILPMPIQQKIADLVRQSHVAGKKSKELLESAKHKVEELIEKGGVV